MKTVLIAMTLITGLLMVSCSIEDLKEELKSITMSAEEEEQTQATLDSLNQVEEEIQIAQALQDSLLQDSLKTEQLSAINLIKFYTSRPNSAGGVDFYITWENLSPKTVKYATFKVDAYNAVNDVVYCEIDDGTARLKCTGPIKQGKIDKDHWGCLWYNYSIDYARIVEIYITYTDGSTLTIEKENIKELGYYREDNKF